MACPDVFDAFAVATESLDREVHLKASPNSRWLNLIPRSVYKGGTGLVQTTFTIERQEPTEDEEEWSPIVLATGTGAGACTWDPTAVNFGYTARTYSPERKQIKGPVLCKDDLIFDHNVAVFLNAYITAISLRAQRSWEKRYEKLYIGFSKKGIATGSFALTAAGASLTQPISDSELTQEMLDAVALDLINSGATNPDSQGFITLGETGPIFTLFIGMQISNRLAKNNAELRSDIRWATSGQGQNPSGQLGLLQRLGASRVLGNFRHLVVLDPPRYTYNGTTYVRVNTYQSNAATKGFGSVYTSAYLNAPYEAVIVANPHVFTSEILKPVNAVGGLNWSPTSFMGDWKWVTGGAKIGLDCLDPLEKYGQHFAEYGHAARPEFPEYGVTLIFKRCPFNSFTKVYCT